MEIAHNIDFDEFEPIGRKQWLEQISRDLKSDTQALNKVDLNGVKHLAFASPEGMEEIPQLQAIQESQPSTAGWKIMAEYDLQHVEIAAIQKELQEGLDEAYIACRDVDQLAALRQQQHVEGMYFCLSPDCVKHDLPALNHIILRPFSSLDATSKELPEHAGSIERFLQQKLNQFHMDHCIELDGTVYRTAGGNEVQEMAFLLHQLADFYSQYQSGQLSVKNLSRAVQFKLGISNRYFNEIAKGRAFYYLLKKFHFAYGIEAESKVTGHSLSYYLAHRGIDNNLLRLTTMAMAGIQANYRGVALHPAFLQQPERGRRLSRNIQLLLRHESHFGRQADLVKGSYYLEKLTADYAEVAWNLFLELEASGDWQANWKSGKIKDLISMNREKEIAEYRSQEKIMIGVNKFGMPDEVDQDTYSGSQLSKQIIS
jgi:methylmalonyl-CoA mutase